MQWHAVGSASRLSDALNPFLFLEVGPMLKRLAVVALTAAVLVAPGVVEAQGACETSTCDVTQPLSATVAAFSRLRVANGTGVGNFTAPDWAAASPTQLDDGLLVITANDVAAVSVAANKDWTVQIGADWTSGTKAVGDVRWSLDAFNTDAAMPAIASPVTLFNGNPGGYNASGHTRNVGLATTWRLTDPAASYTLTVTYRLVSP